MTGTEPFKPFITTACYGQFFEVEFKLVSGEVAPNRKAVYLAKIKNLKHFYEIAQRLRAFYGDNIEFGYAYPMGMQAQSDYCFYAMVEVKEPDVIPGYTMIRFRELMKKQEEDDKQ